MWFTDNIKLRLGIPLQSIFLCLDLKRIHLYNNKRHISGTNENKGTLCGSHLIFDLTGRIYQAKSVLYWLDKDVKGFISKTLRSQLQGLEVFLSLQSRLVGSKAGKESFFTTEQHRKFHCSDLAYDSIHLQP